MTPVAAAMLRPAGRPVALQVSGSPSLSLALIGRVTGAPSLLFWLPALLTTGVSAATFQVKVTLPVLWPSLADTVTLYGLPLTAALVIVPLRTPVLESMLRPGGRPVALQVSGSPSLSVL